MFATAPPAELLETEFVFLSPLLSFFQTDGGCEFTSIVITFMFPHNSNRLVLKPHHSNKDAEGSAQIEGISWKRTHLSEVHCSGIFFTSPSPALSFPFLVKSIVILQGCGLCSVHCTICRRKSVCFVMCEQQARQTCTEQKDSWFCPAFAVLNRFCPMTCAHFVQKCKTDQHSQNPLGATNGNTNTTHIPKTENNFIAVSYLSAVCSAISLL